jgi:hypothetical protein
MMLSRLACILIYVYTTQVAAAQPAATARERGTRVRPRGAGGAGLWVLRSKLADAGVRIETVRGASYRFVAS